MKYAKNIIYILLGLISLFSLFLITFTSSYIVLDRLKPSSNLSLTGAVPVSSVISRIPRAYVIQSGSMEPAIKTASIVISSPQPNYFPGDIITFRPEGRGMDFVTHRIEFKEFPNGVEGDAVYKTSGDANEDFDRWEVTNEQIVGKVMFSVPYLGYVADFAKKPQGFILLVIVPATIVIYEELKFLKRKLLSLLRRAKKKTKTEGNKDNGLPKVSAIIPIFGAGILLIGLTSSLFSDSEKSSDNVLSAWAPIEEISQTLTSSPPDQGTTIYLNQPGGDLGDQYGYNHDYSTAIADNVYFTYVSPFPEKLSGVLTGSGLKPYATYQAKFEGVPTCADSSGNDLANEYVGYKGRWTCTDCGGSALSRNRTDAQYEANSYFRGDSSECIAGYLVWDFFTADPTGNATAPLETLTSYHVLRCGGGTCGVVDDSHLSPLDSTKPTVLFCPEDKVNGEIEPGRGGCGGLSLDPGIYDLKMTLTEESFHQGSWATVLVGDIEFEILPTP